MATARSTSQAELSHVAHEAQDVLISVRTVFPFTLFPDTLTIDRVKVTITKRSFFSVAEVISIQIEDFLNVEADIGPLLGSLKIWTRFFSTKPLRINYLKRSDASNVKKVLQGYIIARNKMINCSQIPKHELVPLLFRLGEEAAVEV